MAAPRLLARLERIARRFDSAAAADKARLLSALERTKLSSAAAVVRLHEVACFLRAYPDDARVERTAASVLDGFARRPDLVRHRDELADSGIAGTAIRFPFLWPTARWLAERFPGALSIDWDALDDDARLLEILPLLLPYAHAPDPELALGARAILQRVKSKRETDAEFVLRRFEWLDAGPHVKTGLFDALALPLVLGPVHGGPSRTRAQLSLGQPRIHQRQPLDGARRDLRRALEQPPVSVRSLTRPEAERAIACAREAMITRGRELDGFDSASPDDARLVDCGGGTSLVCLGLVPEQRALIETIYVFLLLHNDVPVGYFQSALLFGSAEVNYHVFASFRGAESAALYARSLAVVRHLFASDAFSIHPYQLGHENPDARGAFWFYEKLGFRPSAPRAVRAWRRERARMRRDPTHRSSDRALDDLSSGHAFFFLGSERDDVAGKVSLGRIALAADPERAALAGRLLGFRSLRGFSPHERLWWERWSPLVVALPGVARWTPAEKRALVDLIRAKAARREQEFAAQLDRHRALRRALLRLSAGPTT